MSFSLRTLIPNLIQIRDLTKFDSCYLCAINAPKLELLSHANLRFSYRSIFSLEGIKYCKSALWGTFYCRHELTN